MGSSTTVALKVESFGITPGETVVLQSLNGIQNLVCSKVIQHHGSPMRVLLNYLGALLGVCDRTSGETKSSCSCLGG